MRALIAGAGGQLGRSLQATAPGGATVLAPAEAEFDITDRDAVSRVVADANANIVINAAAYTAVDKAEAEPEQAHLINATAVAHLAEACAATGARLIHISTDFIFDGTSATPYRPDDQPNPQSVYGASKWAGEQAAGAEALIVRTAWVYAPTGHNFVRTMLRLMAERDEVRVVADQVGTPTYAPHLAACLWDLADKGATGIHHFTNAGVASWYDFALAIQEEALTAGILKRQVPVVPIATTDFPTPARRPAYSVLDKTSCWQHLGSPAVHWRVALRQMIGEIRDHG